MTTDTMRLQDLFPVVRRAGEAIMQVYGEDFVTWKKSDQSPLTEADQRSHHLIAGALAGLTPDIPVLSEESKAIDYDERRAWPRFWLVDPLDGTKEFINRNGEFTVNIALVEGQRPVLGLVYVPVQNILYYASQGKGSYKINLAEGGEPQRIQGKPLPQPGEAITIVGSRSHASEALHRFIEDQKSRYRDVQFRSAGSALKFCLVAEGEADLYPRLGPTMEWDTAAADIIVWESGKRLWQWGTEQPLLYNKPSLLNPDFLCS